MNSAELESYGFINWYLMSGQLLSSVPAHPGVYVMKVNQSFGRYKGNSDILYIGRTTCVKSGLRGRIRQYFHPGVTQITNIRINKLLVSKVEIYISFIVYELPKELEKKLLEQYYIDHIDLPPQNRQA